MHCLCQGQDYEVAMRVTPVLRDTEYGIISLWGCFMMRAVSSKRQSYAIKSALFNSRMEGFVVPESALRDGRLILSGKASADELVLKYKAKYSRS